MSELERLENNLQRLIDEFGVTNVHFSINEENYYDATEEERASEANKVLEAFIEGDITAVPYIDEVSELTEDQVKQYLLGNWDVEEEDFI